MILRCLRRSSLSARQRIGRGIRWSGTVGLCWLAMTSPIWAQPLEPEPEEKGYVVSYMIILFAVSFGLLMICRGSKRSTSFRRTE